MSSILRFLFQSLEYKKDKYPSKNATRTDIPAIFVARSVSISQQLGAACRLKADSHLRVTCQFLISIVHSVRRMCECVGNNGPYSCTA
jgi:hypothetical protein